jgi:hypothetical protein
MLAITFLLLAVLCNVSFFIVGFDLEGDLSVLVTFEGLILTAFFSLLSAASLSSTRWMKGCITSVEAPRGRVRREIQQKDIEGPDTTPEQNTRGASEV